MPKLDDVSKTNYYVHFLPTILLEGDSGEGGVLEQAFPSINLGIGVDFNLYVKL